MKNIIIKISSLLFLLLYAINSQAQPYAYIANTASDNVSKVNTVNGAVVATINVGSNPSGVAITPDKSKVYVTNANDNTVSCIDAATNTVVATISVGNYPFGIVAHPDGSKIYVGNNGTTTVSEIDVATNTVTNTITVGTGPYGLAFSPNGIILFVVNQFDNTLSMVATGASSAYATINVGTQPRNVVCSKDGKTAYVTNRSDDNVSVIDVLTQTQTSTFNVGFQPFDVELSPDGMEIYVSNSGVSTVTAYETTNYSLLRTYNTSTPRSIDLTPDGTNLYVTNFLSNTVTRFITNDPTLSLTTTVGSNPISLGNFLHTDNIVSGQNYLPIFKGGNGQGFAEAEIQNNTTIFAGGNGQGFAEAEIQNNTTIFAGGNGQGFAEAEIQNNTTIFAGGNGQGYAMDEIVPITWIGSSDTDWLNASNWSSNSIPTLDNSVRIPSGVGNYPVLPSGNLGIKEGNGTNYVCKSLFIQNGASLTLNTNTQILNKGIIQINGDLNHYSDLDNAFYNSNGAKVVVKSSGNLKLYDATQKHEFPDFILDSATLTVDTGTVLIADAFQVKNGSQVDVVAGTLDVKKVGQGSNVVGFLIDASSTMNFKGTMNLGGQTSTGTPENALTWDENATINADSADFNFVQPTSASATTGNDINVAFGGHKIATITGTSSGYIYPHFQDDLEVAGAMTVNGTDKFYQENGTIEIGGSLTGTGDFLANNGAFKFGGIDFCDVDIRNEFHDLIIEKSNGAFVTAMNNEIKVKNDLEVNSGTFDVNAMTNKPDVDVDNDFKIADGALMNFFGYQMEINVGGSYLNSNTQPFIGGFQNFGGEGLFVFDGTGNLDICAGNTDAWGDTIRFANGGIYNLKSDLILTSAIMDIVSSLIEVDNDTLILNPASLNDNYGANNFIITDGNGAVKINNVGNGDTLLIPIGPNSTDYRPVKIINDGSMDNFFVSSKQGVKINGTTGGNASQNSVDITWEVEEENAGGSDVEMIFEWKAADELPGFDRNIAKIIHYKNGQWIEENSDPVQGNDPYTISVKNINTFSPFAIANQSAVLPVECLSFEAKTIDNQVLLNWQTASELNNNYFAIERSIDGQNFEQIGQIEGNGTTITTSYYQYIDETSIAGMTYYYRLKQVDFDGNFEYACGIVSIKIDGELITQISSPYPNPAKDVIAIDANFATTKNINIQIINSIGQVVLQQQQTIDIGTLHIDISALAIGDYQIILSSDDLDTKTYQFIKIK